MNPASNTHFGSDHFWVNGVALIVEYRISNPPPAETAEVFRQKKTMFYTSIFCGSLFCGSAVHILKDVIADSPM